MKKMMMALALLWVTWAQAQDKMPAEIRETFQQQYPRAEQVSFEDNLLEATVEFVLDKHHYKAFYTRKGQWKYTEKDAAFDQLPLEVKDGFRKSKFAGWEILETKEITRAGGTFRYRIQVRKNSLQKKTLYFNQEGQLMDDKFTL